MDTRNRIPREALGAFFGRRDEETVAELVRLTAKCRSDPLLQHATGLGAVVFDMDHHRGEGVREGAGIPVDGEQLVDARPSLGEPLGGGVVGRGEPPVSESGDPSEPGVRSPASDPDGRASRLHRLGLQSDPAGGVELAVERVAVGTPQRAQGADGLVEPRPAFLPR